MRHDLIAIGLDDFTRHRTQRIGERQRVNEARIRLLQPDLKRIPVEHAQSVDLLCVIERALVLYGALSQAVDAKDSCGFQNEQHLAFPTRIKYALDRVDVVGRDQFAPLAAKGGIVVENYPWR